MAALAHDRRYAYLRWRVGVIEMTAKAGVMVNEGLRDSALQAGRRYFQLQRTGRCALGEWNKEVIRRG